MRVETLLTRYSLTAQARGLSGETVAAVKVAVRFFDNFMGGIPDVRKVSGEDLQRFVLALRRRQKWQGREQQSEQTLSSTTVNTYCRGVKAFWAWLKAEGITTKNPLAAVPAPKLPKRLPKTYTEEEMSRVLRAAEGSDRDSAMVYLFLDSGMRLGELAGLNKADVDTRAGQAKVLGKGSKERVTFFSKETGLTISLYVLDERPEPLGEDRLFLTQTGHPMTRDRVQKILVRLGQRAGLSQRLSPHHMRHTYATLSLKHGANLEFLRRSMGHSSSKTTEVYISVADADVAEAHRQFSPIANLARRR